MKHIIQFIEIKKYYKQKFNVRDLNKEEYKKKYL